LRHVGEWASCVGYDDANVNYNSSGNSLGIFDELDSPASQSEKSRKKRNVEMGILVQVRWT
jgi:hypothetical protein